VGKRSYANDSIALNLIWIDEDAGMVVSSIQGAVRELWLSPKSSNFAILTQTKKLLAQTARNLF
jgi:hypothetical protein